MDNGMFGIRATLPCNFLERLPIITVLGRGNTQAVPQRNTVKEVYGMIQKRLFYGLSAVVALASALLLSGCGGGSSAPTPGTLTGSAAVGSSAVSRVGRASVGNLQNQLNRIRPSQRSANLITRGRQGLDFDEELGLYYRYRSNATGVWIELFEDAAGERHAGEIVCKEDDSSYETIINIGTGAQQQRAYFRLTETNDSTRFKLRARYEDPRTGERTSIVGDLIIAPQGTPLDENEDDGGEDDGNGEDDWTDNFDWWENDGYCGDDYFGEDDEFFGEDDLLCCNDTPADYRHPPRKVNAHTKRTQQQKNCGASCTPHPSPTPHDAPNATPDYAHHPQTCA